MDNFINTLQDSCDAQHELFISYINSGFTREEALEIIIRIIIEGMKPNE